MHSIKLFVFRKYISKFYIKARGFVYFFNSITIINLNIKIMCVLNVEMWMCFKYTFIIYLYSTMLCILSISKTQRELIL